MRYDVMQHLPKGGGRLRQNPPWSMDTAVEKPYFYPVRSFFADGIRPDLLSPTGSSSAESSCVPEELYNPGLVHLPPLDDESPPTHSANARFEHVLDERGNHSVVEPSGKVRRCEDEPIRTPGAVQAFGVLVAVQDTEDSLVVRHVSENSSTILGLPPDFLFSLRSFTDTLPELQADALWDNIEFLGQPKPPDTVIDDDDQAPHIFPLSGWGAPGSSSPDVNGGRLLWRCWCAAHRPFVSPSCSESSTSPSLIILEFELQRDTHFPLYPPSSILGAFSDADSISHARFGTWNASDENTIPSSKQGITSVASDTIGLEGQEDWLPSAEDIVESTTNYAKPIPSLEKLRKTNNPEFRLQDVAKHPSPSRRRSHRRSRCNDEIFDANTMNIFAIMEQVNQQLGAVTKIDLFLKVVAGVLKDLTLFHRVLVYQFDEAWNGQVVAELLDWSQNRDLYRGLRFPASDIPEQARALYAINKVRLLYDRTQETARIVVGRQDDLSIPLDLTHCYLRAMSPVHIKCILCSSFQFSLMCYRFE